MKVFVADDQAEVRSALRILLEQEEGFEMIGEAVDFDSLLTGLKKDLPELILLDWELSDRSAACMVPILRQLANGLKIIAMSVRPEAAKAAMEAGVDAFISKGENPDRLLAAISMVKDRA